MSERVKMLGKKPKLLFVSTRFLFPTDTGGQIRTAQILRGMKGGEFEITLVSPVPENAYEKYKTEIDSVSDRFLSWPETKTGALYNILRMRHIKSTIPIPVLTDWSRKAHNIIKKEMEGGQDIVVFDFPHAAILAPQNIYLPSVLFTHNVEAEIFQRHREVAQGFFRKYIWNNQYKKMFSYEKSIMTKFDSIIAVSDRDKKTFVNDYGTRNVHVIQTGVDLEYFEYNIPSESNNIVFTGSMDWMANIDGIEFFLEEIWPLVKEREPEAKMTVVGRNPPSHLVERARTGWKFTNFVDDVRPYMKEAGIYVIPLRVGGGTRLKVFEAMASGCPVVSTTIGVEGLPLIEGEHYLRADAPEKIAESIVKLMKNKELRYELSRKARQHVEDNFSFKRASAQFEKICSGVLAQSGR